jgi:hypothetical protein
LTVVVPIGAAVIVVVPMVVAVIVVARRIRGHGLC